VAACCQIVSALAQKAYKEKAEYFYQINDDTVLKSKGAPRKRLPLVRFSNTSKQMESFPLLFCDFVRLGDGVHHSLSGESTWRKRRRYWP
jgi:hypothetical protein